MRFVQLRIAILCEDSLEERIPSLADAYSDLIVEWYSIQKNREEFLS